MPKNNGDTLQVALKIITELNHEIDLLMAEKDALINIIELVRDGKLKIMPLKNGGA